VSGLLDGVRILDLTRLLPGPAATMHLADLGADVIKVEDTAEGDYIRSFPPQVRNAEGAVVNPIFEAVNRGKRSIAIDLKRADGRALLLALVRRSDALVEGFRPGVLARLGLDWPVLHAENRKLVLVSLSGYGQSGPLGQRAGHDLNYIAMTGVLDQNRVDGVPAIPNLQIGDLLGGTLATLSALLAALLAAQRSGEGRQVDVAMTDGLLAHHFFAHAQLDAGSEPRSGRTLLSGGAPCYRTYRAADGRDLAVGALELKFWQAFCTTVDLPELAERHWSLGEVPGSERAERTAQRVATRVAEKTSTEWLARFDAVDACVTPVLTPAEALAHPHFAARGLVRKAGMVSEVGPLAQFSDHVWKAARAPAAGEHTRALLAELGYAPQAIEELVSAGTVKAAA
jgi:crotonobetainyl-CoA:carnitine CoA-transferase CaiB-like acyl-CoA transferase